MPTRCTPWPAMPTFGAVARRHDVHLRARCRPQRGGQPLGPGHHAHERRRRAPDPAGDHRPTAHAQRAGRPAPGRPGHRRRPGRPTGGAGMLRRGHRPRRGAPGNLGPRPPRLARRRPRSTARLGRRHLRRSRPDERPGRGRRRSHHRDDRLRPAARRAPSLPEHCFAAGILAAAQQGEIEASRCPMLFVDYLGPSLDTTISAIGNAIWLLATHPDQWQLLRADPASGQATVNEALRLESPISCFTRVAEVDTVVDGVRPPGRIPGAGQLRLGQPRRATLARPRALRHHPRESPASLPSATVSTPAWAWASPASKPRPSCSALIAATSRIELAGRPGAEAQQPHPLVPVAPPSSSPRPDRAKVWSNAERTPPHFLPPDLTVCQVLVGRKTGGRRRSKCHRGALREEEST